MALARSIAFGSISVLIIPMGGDGWRGTIYAAALAVGLCACAASATAGEAETAQATEDAVAKFKNYFPREIMAMSEKERSSSVPMMYIGAANLGTSKGGSLVIQANLNALMYNGLADYEGAKRAFQADLGEEPTGELTVWQIYTLGYRASRSSLTYVSFFPYDFGGSKVDSWAYVQGTVKILDEKIAYPINHVVIECDREEGVCKYRQIALMLPDEKSFTQSYHVGKIADESYKITRWERDQIDAVPYNNTACRINQLSLNFTTKEFYEIARNNTAGNCETSLGVTLPRLEKPRVSQIVDGREIVDAEFKRISEEGYRYLASAFRARVESMAKLKLGNVKARRSDVDASTPSLGERGKSDRQK